MKEKTKTAIVYFNLSLSLIMNIFYGLSGIILTLFEAGWSYIKGHEDCPGPTGWAPGSSYGCEWCNPKKGS